jgi:hypothetical protein
VAESGLSLTFGQLRSAVGYKLGHGRNPDDWSDDDLATINWVLAQGLRNFYFPAPLPGQGHVHEWSFLKSMRTVSTIASQFAYQLTDDFAGIEGPLTISSAANSYQALSVVSDGWIRAKQALNPTLTGIPKVAAVVPRAATPGASMGQRWDLWLYPTPQAVYSVNFRQRVAPQMPDSDDAIPYGGAAHAQTILISCLAAAELSVDDMTGVHAQEFLTRLAASVTQDRGLSPEKLGYNGDGQTAVSDRIVPTVTYQNIHPDDW